MKILKIYIITASLGLIISSCTKVIDLKLGNNSGQLVIEANINNARTTQTVKLSRNVPFDSTNTYPPVTGANVTITDDKGDNYQLAESPAGIYTIDRVEGISGNSYTLTVLTGGKTYTAISVMPKAVRMDSLTSANSIFNNNNNDKQDISVHFQDPPGVANQYRFVMYVNNVQVKTIFAYNDEFNDGKYVDIDLQENDIDIYPFDEVTVEMQCIDKPIYTYWLTLAQQEDSGPGGTVTPSNPPTNITPTTLGYFSAHTTQSITFEVK